VGALLSIGVGFGFGFAAYRHTPYMIVGGSGWVPVAAFVIGCLGMFIAGRRLGNRQYQWQQQQQEQTQRQGQQQAIYVQVGKETAAYGAPEGPALAGAGAPAGLPAPSHLLQVGDLVNVREVVQHSEAVSDRVSAELVSGAGKRLHPPDHQPFATAEEMKVNDLSRNVDHR
jgi:hypothetical protein